MQSFLFGTKWVEVGLMKIWWFEERKHNNDDLVY